MIKQVDIYGMPHKVTETFGKKKTWYKTLDDEWHRSEKSVSEVEAALNEQSNDELKAGARKTLSRKKTYGRSLRHKKTAKEIFMETLKAAAKPMTVLEIASKSSLQPLTFYGAKRVLFREGKIRSVEVRRSAATYRNAVTWEVAA